MKTKKLISMLLVFILVAGIIHSNGTVNVNATPLDTSITNEYMEQKLPFANNHVLVVMTNKESLKFSEYTVSSFPEISCKKVTNLTEESDKLLQAQIANEITRVSIDMPQFSVVDEESYHTILCIELNSSGYNEVAKAIKSLSQRDDVLSAEPDFYLSVPNAIVQEVVRPESRDIIPADMYYDDQWGLQKIQILSPTTTRLSTEQPILCARI